MTHDATTYPAASYPASPRRSSDSQGRLLDIIQSEYNEMPGLRLDLRQAARLWDLPSSVCDELLGALLRNGFLTVDAHGRYSRT